MTFRKSSPSYVGKLDDGAMYSLMESNDWEGRPTTT